MPNYDRPKSEIACLDCGAPEAMKLQNVTGTVATNIPLLYLCSLCGCTYTVPPRISPLTDIAPRE